MDIDPIAWLNIVPKELISDIIVQLAKSVGTPSLCNKADIPVIINYTKALSLTNKDLYLTVNNELTSSLLIDTLTKRFCLDQLDLASKINTPGTREFLKRHLEKNGEYKLFKAMQRIFEIAQEVREEFNVLGIRDRQEESPKPHPNYNQTKHGFFISAESTPDRLYTPWGYVNLFNKGYGTGIAFKAFYQAFLKRFKTSFFQFIKPSHVYYPADLYTLASHQHNGAQCIIDLKEFLISGKEISPDTMYKELSEEEVISQQGKEILIFSDIYGCELIYTLDEIDNNQLPKPEMLPAGNYRSYQSTKVIWHILQGLYDEEHGIKKKMKIEKTNQTHKSNNKPKQKHSITSIKTAPEECITLLMQLNKQPLFTGYGLIKNERKVLPLKSYADCRIISILCNNANKKLSAQQAWHIQDFMKGSVQDVEGNDMGSGITIRPANTLDLHFSLNYLKNLFVELITILTTGWRQSTLIENQDIFHTQSEEEWYLFIKAKALKTEDELMLFFASITDIHDEICCDNVWHNHEGAHGYRDTLYLWIKKKSYDKVINALDLHIAS